MLEDYETRMKELRERIDEGDCASHHPGAERTVFRVVHGPHLLPWRLRPHVAPGVPALTAATMDGSPSSPPVPGGATLRRI